MNANGGRVRNLIAMGEGIEREFKTCRTSISRSVYETVCAFLNRQGGHLFLGVRDDGTIQGISSDSISNIRSSFVTTLNNPQKLTPPPYLSLDETVIDGRTVLWTYVPESSQIHRCNGRIYDRNEDGDFDVTDNTSHVSQLYRRKDTTYSENRVYPLVQISDLRSDLIGRCRDHIRINGQSHPWTGMDDLALLKSARLHRRDPITGQAGITLAGVMLLGSDELILSVCPAHRTDLILRRLDKERYDDRDLVRTNLIDSYDRILAFVRKHLPDSFYLEGIERRSLRDVIFREVASNMLIHREYSSRASSRLIIEDGRVTTENPSRPYGTGPLDPETAVPHPKNPVIGAFFREIGRAEELGSGMLNLMKYGREYGGADPQLVEGDLFRMVVAIPEFGRPRVARAVVTVREGGRPVPNAHLLAVFPNSTWKRAVTDANGEGVLDLHTTELPMTVFAAAPGFAAHLKREWVPRKGALAVELKPMDVGGSVIFPEATGRLPGLRGRLNPIRDSEGRTYLYASNIAINRGEPQPTPFLLGEELSLQDADGSRLEVWIVEIVGRSVLVEYVPEGTPEQARRDAELSKRLDESIERSGLRWED